MTTQSSAPVAAVALAELDGQPPRETTVLIGPEGGWAAHEVDHAAAVCRFVTLGARTFRADAMPLVALAALFAIWKEL